MDETQGKAQDGTADNVTENRAGRESGTPEQDAPAAAGTAVPAPPVIESASASTAVQTTSSKKAYAVCAGCLTIVALFILGIVALIYLGVSTVVTEGHVTVTESHSSVQLDRGNGWEAEIEDDWDEAWEDGERVPTGHSAGAAHA